ncbi:MAG: FAD-dependent oxidoreductase [Planctomycetota bacterium]|jgi:protoporphyrinogen oxidase|nr:FAD-dependent oxidoreductase [Planctomycetota bacterium]MDP6838295.1 FAD-dependent oxidoreductase [Planctomycetota bacterium]
MRTFVLGAGLAGLSCAEALVRAGQEVTVLEKESQVGGMARSFQVGPYCLDLGPHRFHTNSATVQAQLETWLAGDILLRQRLSRILLRDRFFDYPLRPQNVLNGLPPTLLLRAFADWAVARTSQRLRPRKHPDFESWVVAHFGRTLYDIFFGPYTTKAWGMVGTSISADWARQRIGHRGLWDVLKQALRPPAEGQPRSLTTEFHYPRRGGIGAISQAASDAIVTNGGVVMTECPVRTLELETRSSGPGQRVSGIRLANGQAIELVPGDQVVNTMALPFVARALRPLPPAPVLSAAGKLRHVAILFIYLEVACPRVSPDHWIYLPQADLRVHRISEVKNFSDASAPGPTTALCCEITCRRGDATWRLDLQRAAQLAEADLVRTGLVEPGSTRPLALRRLAEAYPIYDLEYREHLDLLRAGLRAVDNLHTTGRQGLFRYNNMDHSIAMGQHIAQGFLNGAPRQGAGESAAVAARETYFG